MTGEPRWFRSPPVLFAAGTLVFVVGAELVLGRGSVAPSGFSLFLGRFHPLVVHLPIGVLVLVALAELASLSPRFRGRVDPALALVLPFLLLVTATAFVLGHFLGRAGGYAAHALMLHRRLEFLAAVGSCVSAALFFRHAFEETQASRTAYRVSLALTVALLSVGAHFGGTVTHGDSYLTEYAPGPFKALLGGAEKARAPAGSASAPKPKSSEPLVWNDVVGPIFAKYCVDCHGPKKQKGKLRMDSVEAMLKGGEEGPAIAVGSSATSELVRRVKLPADDDDRMPPEGKPGPTAEELAVIAFWIDRGASPTLRVRDTLAPANGRKVLEAALAKAPIVPGAASSAPNTGAPRSESSAASDETRPDGDASAAKPAGDEREEPPASDEKTRAPATATEPPPAKSEASPASTPSGRAVLAEHCEKCHGPSKKKGGLRVDSLEALLAGGENGAAIVPGNPEKSEIVRRMRLPLASKGHMPPKKEAQPGDAEIAALAAWVRGLAKSASSAPTSSEASAKTETPGPRPAPASHGEGAPENDDAPANESAPQEASAAAPASSAEPRADAPPVAELLTRVPSRLSLYADAVAPLLSKRCGHCHSGAKPAARLRVDDYAALVEGGLSGPGIVPGKPDESLVIQRIGLPATDDDRMPPEGEPPLTADEVALVRFWVERGAARGLSLPAKDVPASPLRAAAEYAPKSGETAALRADAGCAACAVGRAKDSRSAFGVAALALGAFLVRRALRRDLDFSFGTRARLPRLRSGMEGSHTPRAPASARTPAKRITRRDGRRTAGRSS